MGFLDDLPFSPDPFQVEAVSAIEAGTSVVVTAPTGAGKTVIAEAAVEMAVLGGGRAFYTTPIKALSNQKWGDLVHRYGPEDVGLLTGDNSVNPDAPIIVMTTEVLRNMIHARSAALDGLRIIILDEVHYLGDKSRGAVWEEVIIHAPPTAQLVCLSATIANPDQLTKWIARRRGHAELVLEEHRPVPLEAVYGIKDRWRDDRVELLPLFSRGGPNPSIQRRLAARTGAAHRGGRAPRRFVTPRRGETLEALRAGGMLPAIYFIFSRRGCEQAASAVATTAQRKSPGQIDAIHEIVDAHLRFLSDRDLAVLDHGQWLSQLERGVAAHHAGMVPAFKEAVEELFARALLDVVFATETLAVGINMPARAVVLDSLTKFTGETHELMTPSEYTQLTGRAGRRGIDEVGFGVVLHSPYVPFGKVVELAGAGSSMLLSSFRPTYNMAVNLVANYDQARAEELLNASLAQFQRAGQEEKETERITALRTELAAIAPTAECALGSIWEYIDGQTPGRPSMGAVDLLRPGDVIEIPKGRRPGRYVLLKRELGTDPRLHALSAGGKEAKLTLDDLGEGSAVLGSITWKGPFRPRDKRFRQQTVQELRRFRSRQSRSLMSVDTTREPHPVEACPDRDAHSKAARRVRDIESKLERAGASAHGTLVDEFRAVLKLLETRGYVSGWSLEPPGVRLRRIYSEQDLLVSECLRQGLFADCTAAELAALVSAFVFEPRAEEVRDAFPNERTARIGGQVVALWRTIVSDERASRLPETRPPEFGFADLAYAWSQGADLDDLMDRSPVTAGDFVRVARQLLDLLRQVRDAEPAVADAAVTALRSVDRGIVTTGGNQ